MKTERIVQSLFYLLLVIIVVGGISHDGISLISSNITKTLIYIVLATIVGFLIYYYVPKKTKR